MVDQRSGKTKRSQDAYRLAVLVVGELEQEESAKLNEFSGESIRRYLHEINEVTNGSASTIADRGLRESAQLELRSFRSP